MAAQHADVEMMRLLVSYGADPLVVTTNGVSAIMFAAGLASDFSIGYTSIKEQDALAAVKLCYELGDRNVRRTEKYGETALHGAAYRGLSGSNTLIQFLVDTGADVNVRNKRGWSPVTLAEGVYTNNSNTRNPEALALLMKLGGVPSPANVERDAYSVIDEGTQGTIGTQAIPKVVKPEPTTTSPKK
jgi:ankyrin repeat protein